MTVHQVPFGLQGGAGGSMEPSTTRGRPMPAVAPENPASEVLIVGAGPTGLMLGTWLNRSGVRVRIVDSKAGPTPETRAIAVQARTLEFYDQLGLGEQAH